MILSVEGKHVALIGLAVGCGVFEALGQMAQWGITLPFHLTSAVCLATVASLGLMSKDIRDLPTNVQVNPSLLVSELPAIAQAVIPVASAVSVSTPTLVNGQPVTASVTKDMAPTLAKLEGKS